MSNPRELQLWWAKYWERQIGFVAAELDKKSKEVQVARLLNAAGSKAQEIHDLFSFENEETEKDYKKVQEKFREYCRPRKNIVYVRSRSQHEGEPFDK